MDVLTASDIKYLNALKLKKFRQKYGQFIVEGEKLVDELVHSGLNVQYIVATDKWLDNALIRNLKYAIKICSEQQMKKISLMNTPPGLMAMAEIPTTENKSNQINQTCIMLDGIKDPGNMGTIVRIADWYGIETVYCSDDCVDLWNFKTLQSAMGSAFRIEVVYGNLLENLKTARIPALALVLGGSPLHLENLPEKAIIVIGSESHGISDQIQNNCTKLLSINGLGHAESLNAAVATAIACDRLLNR